MVLDWKVLEQSPVFKHSLDKSPVDDTRDTESREPEEEKEARQEITAMAGA